MINAVTLLKRKPGLSVGEFQHYWRHEHAGVIARLPGIRRYVQSHPLQSDEASGEPRWDGIAELWAEDTQAFRDIAKSPAYAAVLEDEARFLDRTATALVLTGEQVIREGRAAADGVKCIRLLNREPRLGVAEFQAYWHDHYGPLIATLPRLDRYVQYPARPGGYAHGRRPVYDGFDVSWFASPDALREALASPAADRARREERQFLADACPRILAREVVFLA